MTGGNDIYLSGASVDDGDFIAKARQNLPTLIAEIHRLHALLHSPKHRWGTAKPANSTLAMAPGGRLLKSRVTDTVASASRTRGEGPPPSRDTWR